MVKRLVIGLSLMCLVVGCQTNNPRTERYIEMLNAEKRSLEDVVYRQQAENEELMRQLELCEGRGRSNDSSQPTPAENPLPRIDDRPGPSGSGDVPFDLDIQPGTPTAPPRTLDGPPPAGLDRFESTPQQFPGPEGPLSRVPAPRANPVNTKIRSQSRPLAPISPQPGDVITDRSDSPPPVGLDGGESRHFGSIGPGETDRRPPAGLDRRDAPSTAQKSPPQNSLKVRDSKVTHITMNRVRTGGADFDGVPGDDGIELVIEPRNQFDQFVARFGRVDVALLDPQKTGPDARVANWKFEPDKVRQGLRQREVPGIYLRVRWREQRPENSRLQLFVRLETEDGQQFQLDQTIYVALPEQLSARWTRREQNSGGPRVAAQPGDR